MRPIIAKIIEIVVYDVISTHDLTEGRTPDFVAGTFLTMNEAKEAGKGKYIMGDDCPVRSRSAS